MSLDINKTPFLFSMSTMIAYTIANRNYKSHYVWCSDCFHSDTQPPTSDPQTIGNTYLNITKGDRHQIKIMDDHIAAVLRGAQSNYDAGVITEKAFKRIQHKLACFDYADFFPVLYIIDARKIIDKYEEVPVPLRASDSSVEYLIRDLKKDEFKVILFKDLLNGIVSACDADGGE